MPASEDRARKALDVAEALARGEATRDECLAAAAAASSAAAQAFADFDSIAASLDDDARSARGSVPFAISAAKCVAEVAADPGLIQTYYEVVAHASQAASTGDLLEAYRRIGDVIRAAVPAPPSLDRVLATFDRWDEASDPSGLLNADEVAADLGSGDPRRIDRALRTLDAAWMRREFAPVPFPGPDCLDAFVHPVPDEVVARYLSVLTHYPDFEPTPSGRDVRHARLEVVIRHGREHLVLDAALPLCIDAVPGSVVSDAFCWLANRGLHDRSEERVAEGIVHVLLDGDATRSATIDGLRSWVKMEMFTCVIDEVRPRLSAAERSYVDGREEETSS